jgi:hypothetical protein
VALNTGQVYGRELQPIRSGSLCAAIVRRNHTNIARQCARLRITGGAAAGIGGTCKAAHGCDSAWRRVNEVRVQRDVVAQLRADAGELLPQGSNPGRAIGALQMEQVLPTRIRRVTGQSAVPARPASAAYAAAFGQSDGSLM